METIKGFHAAPGPKSHGATGQATARSISESAPGLHPLGIRCRSFLVLSMFLFGISAAKADEPVRSRLDRLNTISRLSIKQGAEVVNFSRWKYSSEHNRLTMALEQAKTANKYLRITLKDRAAIRAIGRSKIRQMEPLLKVLLRDVAVTLATAKNLGSSASTAKRQMGSVVSGSKKFSSRLASAVRRSYPRNYEFPVMILKTMAPLRHDIFYRAGEVVDVQLTIANSLLNCPGFKTFPSYYSYKEAPITGFFEVSRTAGPVNTTIRYRTTMTNFPGSILFNVISCSGLIKSLPIYNRGRYSGEGGGSGGGGSTAWDGNWSGTIYTSTPIGSGTNSFSFTVNNGSINEENGNFTGRIDAQGNFTGQILLGAGIESLALTGKFSGNSCTINGSRTNVVCRIQATRQ